jgi:hypothetical protein
MTLAKNQNSMKKFHENSIMAKILISTALYSAAKIYFSIDVILSQKIVNNVSFQVLTNSDTFYTVVEKFR